MTEKGLDLELLDKIFAKKNPLDISLICFDCKENICFHCGNEIDCGTFPSECSKISKARLEHDPIELEDFKYGNLFGKLEIALDSTHIIGVLPGKVSINTIAKIYNNCNYQELKNKTFLNYYDKYCSEENLYLLPYNKKEGEWNFIYQTYVNNALKLVENPEFYYSFNNPLIIQNNNFTVIISVRTDDNEEGGKKC